MALRCQFWLPMFILHLSFCHARHDFGIHNIRLLRGQRLNYGSPAVLPLHHRPSEAHP